MAAVTLRYAAKQFMEYNEPLPSCTSHCAVRGHLARCDATRTDAYLSVTASKVSRRGIIIFAKEFTEVTAI